MTIPILSTKIHIPPIRENILSRSGVLACLDTKTGDKLTLISAPAGYGKTTLLSQWAQHAKDTVVWVSLDESDNDLSRFLTYLIAALKGNNPSLGETSQDVLLSSPQIQAKSVLIPLLNDIQNTLSANIFLILDDYHVIEEQTVHDAVDFLLEYAPTQLNLVIASRSTPLLALSRLRARRQMSELRAEDLRFSKSEMTTFLNDVMGLDLSDADVFALEACTEGWIAGLQLAALSLQDERDAHQFIQAFTGSHRHILDYLVDEVLNRQSAYIQDFLLKTSVLDHLSGELCEAVCDLPVGSGQAILETLESKNLFIVPLDHERQWYRYQHLFSDILRNRLSHAIPTDISTLHQRASDWYGKNQRVYEAMGHALAADDIDRAVKLVEETDPANMVLRGEVKTLLKWLNALPKEVVRSRPRLSLSYAWALFIISDIEEIETYLNDALVAIGALDGSEGFALKSLGEAGKRTEDASIQVQGFLGEIAALRAWVALNHDKNTQRAIDLAQEAIARLPADSFLMQGALKSVLGDAYSLIDRMDEAQQAYTDAITISKKGESDLTTMVYLNDLARLQMSMGELHQAAEIYRQVLDWAHGRRRSLYPVGGALIGLGNILREWNDLEGAEKLLREGIAQCELGGYSQPLVFGYVTLAQVREAHGESNAAQDLLQKAKDVARESSHARVLNKVKAYEAQFGDQGTAKAWKQAYSAKNDLDYTHEIENLTLARLLIRDRDKNGVSSALELLEQLLQLAKKAGRIGSLIEILTLQAIAYDASGDSRSLPALERALSLAEPQGYLRIFLDEGAPMASLLHQASTKGILPQYVGMLLSAFGEMEQTEEMDTLSRRELDVLRCLVGGMSNREIADALSISTSTVNTHTNRIYEKLGVHSRVQAVNRAKEQGLL